MHQVKAYTPQDYPKLVSWWQAHSFPAVPANVLPPLGFLIEEDSTPRAACFAYMDNGGTGVAMLEWTVTNPDNTPRQSLKALRLLIPHIIDQLKALDYDKVLTSCRQESLANIYKKSGFQMTDSGMFHLIHITPS